MKVEYNYLLTKLGEDYILYPFGQPLADMKPAIKLNKSGVLLWEALQRNEKKEEIFKTKRKNE